MPYEEAIRAFNRSYALNPVPELLFNIAQAARLAGDCRQALQNYQKYLQAAPDGWLRDKAEVRLRELDGCGEKVAPPVAAPAPPACSAPAPPLAAEAPSRRVRRRLLWSGVATLSVGVALLQVGVTFDLLANAAADELNHPPSGFAFDPSVVADARRDQAFAVGFLVAGAAAVTLGGSLTIAGRYHDSDRRAAAR